MATIHVFRHAEAMHNVDTAFRDERDPGLSAKGIQDSKNLADEIHMPVVNVFSSPLRRAIQTSRYVFPEKQIIPLPQITEAGSSASGFGSPREALIREFGRRINANYLPGTYANLDPDSPFAYDLPKIEARFAQARKFLASQAAAAGPGANIAVITHGQSCHFLTEDWEGPVPGEWRADWDGNLKYRSYTIDSSTGDWYETVASRLRRKCPPYPVPGDQAVQEETRKFLCNRIIERTQEVRKLYDKYRVPKAVSN
ncbi:histidine phosphatase superfamily [Hypoxylon rubiginosum]|uniref:Histidine phosphatase superfamily n=1 Tax=Hypoxylon rubiginosum TaxID=110542 RepID=A0ACC0CVA3_9PEZI|nr:histidine phosphatase superfamily [Hypoxylon rubiginosum]